MPTGKKPAAKAGKGSAGKKPAKSARTVAASDLAQAPHKPKSK
jgi:hypothetical protein